MDAIEIVRQLREVEYNSRIIGAWDKGLLETFAFVYMPDDRGLALNRLEGMLEHVGELKDALIKLQTFVRSLEDAQR